MKNSPLTEYSRLHDWHDKIENVTVEDVKAVTALELAMGLSRLPAIPLHWSTHPLFSNTFFPSVMSRNRYQSISSMIHFSDNQHMIARGHEGYDPLFKIKPVLNYMNERFTAVYQPGKELDIDESMVGFKGRLSFIQFMPAKRTRFGIKNWSLNESRSGYACHLTPYTGKANDAGDGARGDDRHWGLAARVVLDLLDGYENLGHHVYMDNFYSDPDLYDRMRTLNIGAVGTVRAKRKGLPASFKIKMKKGDAVKFERKDTLLACQF